MSLDDKHLTLGPFRVDAAGTLEAITASPAPGFSCHWRDRHVYAKLLPGQPAGGASFDWRLHLQTPLGRVPSTARPANQGRREASFQLLRALPATVPQGWRIGLAADHRVLLEVERHIPLPITATTLVTEMTCFLLTLAPYLDLLEETGMTRPSASAATPAGNVNT
jgi:hypothetical protein